MTDIDDNATQSNDQTDNSANGLSSENSKTADSALETSDSATSAAEWYIVKAASGHCEILAQTESNEQPDSDSWGPFSTQSEAIARRVGLIRSGKCQPQ